MCFHQLYWNIFCSTRIYQSPQHMKYIMGIMVSAAIISWLACTSPADKTYEQDSTNIKIEQDSSINIEQPEKPTGSDVIKKDSPSHSNGTNVSPTTVSSDSVVNVIFRDTNRQVVRGKLGPDGRNVTFQFNTSKPATLNALISPDKIGCNIRFSTITMPGGKTDGPFGKELKYKLDQAGTYKLSIGNNRMAGEIDPCGFSLRIILE
jgi:hypothetical protein